MSCRDVRYRLDLLPLYFQVRSLLLSYIVDRAGLIKPWGALLLDSLALLGDFSSDCDDGTGGDGKRSKLCTGLEAVANR